MKINPRDYGYAIAGLKGGTWIKGSRDAFEKDETTDTILFKRKDFLGVVDEYLFYLLFSNS